MNDYFIILGAGKGQRFSQKKPKQFFDFKDYLHESVMMEALEDFYMIGFNTLNKNIDWDGEIKKESFKDFYSLQKKWKETGEVSLKERNNLWNSYKYHLELFYDYLNK